MTSFQELLEESGGKHGHLCPGQVLGVRMAMLGCRLLGIEDPLSRKKEKDLIVFVEIDRCATDAIESVTGCTMGKRTLKFRDYGIMAATFCHLGTGEAYRVVAREESRLRASLYAHDVPDHFQCQVQAYRVMPDAELFTVQRVCVDLAAWEMPGPPRRHARCTRCGQIVRDGREVRRALTVLCRPCADEAYFQPWVDESAKALS